MDWYDYGARFYDNQIGRFLTIDPMIEEHYDYTGYAYCYNNPINLIDPLGLDTLPTVTVVGKKPDEKPPIQVGWFSYCQRTTPSTWQQNMYGFVDQTAKLNFYTFAILTTGGAEGEVGEWVMVGGRWVLRRLLKSDKSIDDILKDAKPGRTTKGKTEQWEKKGDVSTANKDFDDLNPSNVNTIKTPRGTVRTGTKDGKTVTVRPFSSDGRPTLEIRNPINQRGIEIRYGN